MEGRLVPETLWARTNDGVGLSIRRFRAEAKRRAVLVCGHAMMANGRYFHKGDEGFAAYVARQGIDCYVFDFRAHGDSAMAADRAIPDHGFDDYVFFDLPAILSAVARDAQVDPGELCYLGHSLGGIVALGALGRGTITPPRKLSLWAVSLWLEGPGGGLRRRAVMGLYELLARVVGHAPIRKLGLGSDNESKRYVAQLSQWARRGQWLGGDGFDYQAALAQIEVETLVVTGAGDRLCRPEDADRFRKRLSRAHPLRIVDQEQGDPLSPDHFTLFTKPEMAPVWDELFSFLEASSDDEGAESY